MEYHHHNSGVIQLFPVRYPDGEIRYVPWPEAAAAMICEVVTKGAVSVANWLATFRRETLLLWGCGAAVVFVALADGHHRTRRRYPG